MTSNIEGILDPAPTELGDALDLMRVVWKLDHALQRASKRMQSQLGVTGPQRLVIRIVGRFPGITAGHLARVLHVHPSTLTGVIKRLERQGLIRQRSDPRDGRRTLLSLTDKGRFLDARREGTVESCIEGAIGGLPGRELDDVRRVLSVVAEALERETSEQRQ